MIICPSCREEIEEYSHYCDQCGQELVYCSSCARVGMGRRCTQCGGLMISAEEAQQKALAAKQISSVSMRGNDLAISIVNDLTSSHRKHSRRIVALIAFAAVLVVVLFKLHWSLIFLSAFSGYILINLAFFPCHSERSEES